MAYYMVSRMPPGETQLVEAPNAKEAARAVQPAATANYRGTETYMVYECDKEGVNCSDSPEHFTADQLFPEHHP